jgi:hypothetical protein
MWMDFEASNGEYGKMMLVLVRSLSFLGTFRLTGKDVSTSVETREHRTFSTETKAEEAKVTITPPPPPPPPAPEPSSEPKPTSSEKPKCTLVLHCKF